MNDIYIANKYSYELNPEMIKLLGEEFNVEKTVDRFSEAIKGKSPEDAEAEGKTFFEAHGKTWIRKTHKLGEEYPDRTYEVLKMATSNNAELVKMCGPRDPYPEGALGVIEEGAYADMILVEGNPLENIDLVADAEKNFVIIMKDGMIYKNTL